MDLNLAHGVAIVTGATSNIGRAVAIELAREGASVIGVGRDAVARATLADAGIRFVAANLTDPAAPAEILATAEALGSVAMLVNGVGGGAGVRVNAVAPYATIGGDPAAFSAGSRFRADGAFLTRSARRYPEERALRARRTALGRRYAMLEEIAGPVAYLASDRAAFVTGRVRAVDGGALS